MDHINKFYTDRTNLKLYYRPYTVECTSLMKPNSTEVLPTSNKSPKIKEMHIMIIKYNNIYFKAPSSQRHVSMEIRSHLARVAVLICSVTPALANIDVNYKNQ